MQPVIRPYCPEDLPRLAALGMTKGRADNNPTALDSITIEKLLRSIYQ